jgi:flagellar hook-associated protein 1 FlgK
MSLSGAFQIGVSALNASQLAIQVTGNNLANAATPGYSRQVARLAPLRGDTSVPGLSIGHGVGVSEVRRQIDDALQTRLWGGVSDEASAHQRLGILAQVETALNELTDQDLSSELAAFFGAWSEAANGPGSNASVVNQGDKLAGFIRRLRSDLVGQRSQMDQTLGAAVSTANDLLSQIAVLNRAVVGAEAGGATENSLRDQRDGLISELSQYVDVSVQEQPSGAVNILVGSTPVVLGSESRGMSLTSRNTAAGVQVSVTVKADGQTLTVDSGQVGALMDEREGSVGRTIDRLDTLAAALIFETNRLHSTGRNEALLTGTTGTLAISTADRMRPINDPANRAFADLPFAMVNGGFSVTVRDQVTGGEKTYRIDVDLDGIDDSGLAGIADDATPEDLRAALDAVPGLSAEFTPDGLLTVRSDEGFGFSFSEDSASALAVLGVNSYFEGTGAGDIQVRGALRNDPSALATGRVQDGTFVQNANAMALSGLQDAAIQGLGGRSLSSSWLDAVQEVGIRTSAADTTAQASTIVRQSLDAQRASVSGVSVDEEAVNLLNFQQTYQGAARFISVVDDMTQTLMSLV